MAAKMATLDPSSLTPPTAAVAYDSRAESVTLPGGVVSVAGVAVVTGGVELSCGSCVMAFGFWGTLIGLSCVAVGLWDHWSPWRRHHGHDGGHDGGHGDGGHGGHGGHGGISHLLALGLVILSISAATVGSVVTFHLLSRKRRARRRERRREGREVLVEGGGAIKKLTV